MRLPATVTKQNKGFTIIEVLIVLAIAGLIMLIVFLAVPALQRNSRNTSYRNEAARILGASNESISNNNGSPLAASTCSGLSTTGTGCLVTTSPNDAQKVMTLANPKNITDLTIEAQGGSTTSTITKAVLRTGAKCDTTTIGATVAGATRQIALVYSIENAAGNAVAQCTDS